MSVIGGESMERGPKTLVHKLMRRSSMAYPDSWGGGAMAMASAGYHRR